MTEKKTKTEELLEKISKNLEDIKKGIESSKETEIADSLRQVSTNLETINNSIKVCAESSEIETNKDREFQYEITKLQVNIEVTVGVLIGVLAILYGLLSYYAGNIALTLIVDILIGAAAVSLIVISLQREGRFKAIKKKYKLFTKTET